MGGGAEDMKQSYMQRYSDHSEGRLCNPPHPSVRLVRIRLHAEADSSVALYFDTIFVHVLSSGSASPTLPTMPIFIHFLAVPYKAKGTATKNTKRTRDKGV